MANPATPFEQFWNEYSNAKVVKMSRKDLAQDAFQIGMQLGMNLSKMFMVDDPVNTMAVWFNNGMAAQINPETGWLVVGERKNGIDTDTADVPADTNDADPNTGDQPEGQVS